METAVKSEYYIKAGLVILGSSILICNEIMRAGALGMIQALIVVISVWYFSFWVATKAFKIDNEMSMLLSSSVSICGVSAAIATSGAIKGDPKTFICYFSGFNSCNSDDVLTSLSCKLNGAFRKLQVHG